MAALDERRQRFVEFYLEDPNAKKAAIKAGYSPKTAEVQGCRLLRTAQVAQAIDEGRRARRERARLSADDVIAALEGIAMFDPRELFYSEDEVAGMAVRLMQSPEGRGLTLEQALARVPAPGYPKPMNELTLDQARMVVERYQDANGQRVKAYSRERALELLAKHHGLLEDKVRMTVDGSVDLSKLTPEQLAQLEEILGHGASEG